MLSNRLWQVSEEYADEGQQWTLSNDGGTRYSPLLWLKVYSSWNRGRGTRHKSVLERGPREVYFSGQRVSVGGTTSEGGWIGVQEISGGSGDYREGGVGGWCIDGGGRNTVAMLTRYGGGCPPNPFDIITFLYWWLFLNAMLFKRLPTIRTPSHLWFTYSWTPFSIPLGHSTTQQRGQTYTLHSTIISTLNTTTIFTIHSQGTPPT